MYGIRQDSVDYEIKPANLSGKKPTKQTHITKLLKFSVQQLLWLRVKCCHSLSVLRVCTDQDTVPLKMIESAHSI